ncbi:MAG TPA: type IX secretion system membrane protein PorP/SprF, partial [Bacteroidia bacterium]|nr:type IX secretion system membrane protein PorP/SprF [Bacteroidia bacterium]
FGLLGYGKNYFAGFSLAHPAQPDVSFFQGASPLAIKYTANAGVNIPIGAVTISPCLLYQKQGNTYQEVAEGYASFWHISAGIGYRFQKITGASDSLSIYTYSGIIFSLGYTGKLLRVGYNVVYPLSKTYTAESLAMNEFSVAVLIHYSSPKHKKTSGINCPAF